MPPPKDPFQAAIEKAEKANLVRPADLPPCDPKTLLEEYRRTWAEEDPSFSLAEVMREIDGLAAQARQDLADLLEQRRGRPNLLTTRQEEEHRERMAAVTNLLLGKYLAAAGPFFVLALRERRRQEIFGLSVKGILLARPKEAYPALLSCVFHPPYFFSNPTGLDVIPGWVVDAGQMGSFAAALFSFGTPSEETVAALVPWLETLEGRGEKASFSEKAALHAVISIFQRLPDCEPVFRALYRRFESYPLEATGMLARRTKPVDLELDRLRAIVKARPIRQEDFYSDIPKVNLVHYALLVLAERGGDASAREELAKLDRRVERVQAAFQRGRERGEY